MHKTLLRQNSILLTVVITLWGLLAVQCVVMLAAYLLRLQHPGFLLLVAFVEPLLGIPPAVLAFCYLRNRLNRSQGRLMETGASLQRTLGEIRELNSLLPMCAQCGKARRDDVYLAQMEGYASRYSGGASGQGYCLSCQKILESAPNRDKDKGESTP